MLDVFNDCAIQISIHAPAWGATVDAPRLHTRKLHFNPRARVGRDHGSTPLCTDLSHFNPRARVGRDNVFTAGDALFTISIHAPAWGATQGSGCPRQDDGISIHAPAWGATLITITSALPL